MPETPSGPPICSIASNIALRAEEYPMVWLVLGSKSRSLFCLRNSTMAGTAPGPCRTSACSCAFHCVASSCVIEAIGRSSGQREFTNWRVYAVGSAVSPPGGPPAPFEFPRAPVASSSGRWARLFSSPSVAYRIEPVLDIRNEAAEPVCALLQRPRQQSSNAPPITNATVSATITGFNEPPGTGSLGVRLVVEGLEFIHSAALSERPGGSFPPGRTV